MRSIPNGAWPDREVIENVLERTKPVAAPRQSAPALTSGVGYAVTAYTGYADTA